MNKKIFIGAAAVVVIIGVVVAVMLLLNTQGSFLKIDNNDKGSVSVTAQNAGENSSGIGYVTIGDGQELEISSKLAGESKIKIEVYPSDVKDKENPLVDKEFTGTDYETFDLSEGSYTAFIYAGKGATGSVDIHAINR